MARLLTGTLFLPDGSPLANATIYLTSKRNEIAGIVKGLDGAFTTNAGGHYSQSVHEGFYQVSISHPLAGNPSRRWNLGNIQVSAGAAISINDLLQFSEDAQNPIANEIQQMYEQIIAARDAAQLSAMAAGTSATAASASATSASGSATSAAGAATTATTKAGEATTAAATATGAATTANAKAGEATTAAGTAVGAATTATTKAGQASASATAAAGSASNAAASAASVGGVVTAAQSARDDAIAAKNASQGAAGDSIAAAELAGESAGTATTKAGEATAAAATATGAATTATTKAGEASTSATAAADSAASAAASASSVDGVVTAVESARDKAEQWAENDEEVEVEPGKYSSKHWAMKSQDAAPIEYSLEITDASSFVAGKSDSIGSFGVHFRKLYNHCCVSGYFVVTTALGAQSRHILFSPVNASANQVPLPRYDVGAFKFVRNPALGSAALLDGVVVLFAHGDNVELRVDLLASGIQSLAVGTYYFSGAFSL
ncbi:carboxypeptidase-like regulatory domain-containing protein [Cellvibrio mixtus]|uniref:carboxypeptidase-like regulatory domain-containing protein n=1 Tax=Cellvibrio mixtus TaxID=39650 RepID=UPI000693EF2B|nr:carboxypeptidase-like regulatory domain-containing protein [Cellvibrio mixtus]